MAALHFLPAVTPEVLAINYNGRVRGVFLHNVDVETFSSENGHTSIQTPDLGDHCSTFRRFTEWQHLKARRSAS